MLRLLAVLLLSAAPLWAQPKGGKVRVNTTAPRTTGIGSTVVNAGVAAKGIVGAQQHAVQSHRLTSQQLKPSQRLEDVTRSVNDVALPLQSSEVTPEQAQAGSEDVASAAFYGRPADNGLSAANRAAPSAGVDWDGAVAVVAAKFVVDVPTLRRAMAAAEKEMGTPMRSVMSPRDFIRWASESETFRTNFVDPLRTLPPPSSSQADFRPLIARVAADMNVQPKMLMFWLREEGLEQLLESGTRPALLERHLYRIAQARKLELEAHTWPDNAQGQFMRNISQQIQTSGGKSVEEIARSGAFGYITFNGRTVMSASAGRDPDFTGCDYLIYVTRENSGWKMGFYPGGGSSRAKLPAPEAVEEFKKWLKRGIPSLRLIDF